MTLQTKTLRAPALALLLATLTLFPTAAHAQADRPVIFFSDLQSGPKSGGENNAGVFITIYGNNFGSSQGSSRVTVGGVPAVSYKVWTTTKIAFQLGASAVSGGIVVTTPLGSSNGVPFTVRAGAIYFVATAGDDLNPGSIARPWRSIQHALDTMSQGDTVYVTDGVTEAWPDTEHGSVSMYSSGASGMPMALVAYPGAVATIGAAATSTCDIGSVSTCIEGLGTWNPYVQSWWVVAGLRLRGNNNALGIVGPATNWRVVGNDISCAYGDGPTGCVLFSQTSSVAFYGNTVHDTGWRGASSEYQGLYFSTDSNHLDVGWNVIANVQGCRGLQVHSSPLYGAGPDDPTGRNQYDIVIHDNLIHDTTCDGIVLSTIDPSKGRVEIYNNVMYGVGKGPAPLGGGGNFSGIYITGVTNLGEPGGGTVEIYHNTLYDCGAYSAPGSNPGVSSAIENGGENVNLKLRVRNNVIYQTSGEYYVYDWGDNYLPDYPPTSTYISGSNNLFYGSDVPPPSWFTSSSIITDPLFVGLAVRNFHLLFSSPARNAGISLGAAADKDGVPRPPYDLGAFQAR